MPLERLRAWSPFSADVWGHGKLKKRSVATALKAGRLRAEVWDLTFAPGAGWHAERVAFLVLNSDDTPISIDVGAPVLGYYEPWIVQDGHHRLAAAFYRGDATIAADVGGQIDLAEAMLGIKWPASERSAHRRRARAGAPARKAR